MDLDTRVKNLLWSWKLELKLDLYRSNKDQESRLGFEGASDILANSLETDPEV